MTARFERTGFKGLGEEIERKRRFRAAMKLLKTVSFLQRRHEQSNRTYIADVAALFGGPAMLKASELERAEGGGWKFRSGFPFEMEVKVGGYEARVSVPLMEGGAVTVFRVRSEIGVVEVLP
jgi:hypothetical protein